MIIKWVDRSALKKINGKIKASLKWTICCQSRWYPLYRGFTVIFEICVEQL